MYMVSITKIKESDISQILFIHKECISKTNSKYYSAEVTAEWLKQVTLENIKSQLNTSNWKKLNEGNKIIGFCQYDLIDEIIYQIQILPEYQGRGYGKTLYEHMEKEFIHKGSPRVFLNATINARKFYERLGFQVSGKVQFPLGNLELEMYKMYKTF